MGRKFRQIFYYIIILMFCQLVIGALVENKPVFAGVNDFYFSDFTGDYYLGKDADGTSRLRVKESVTAVFPDFNQNKGICRQIPFTNKNGSNVTLPSLTRSDITVTRNGEAEPIYSIDKDGNYFNVCTGTEEYVLGEQEYTFEYEFTKVVTEFNENGKEFQELYWDTNGNGALQRFDKVTAKLHFEDESVWTGEAWCYVGAYGESGQDRCEITSLSDGVQFEAENLRSYENLTFDAELEPDSFTVPAPDKNYAYVWITVVVGVLCTLAIGWQLRKFIKTREKARYYKGIFVKPEYQPHDEYTLPEMAEIYLGNKKDMKVAMLLELVVKKKIEFKKVDKKKWNIIVKDLDGVRGEYLELLAILNGGTGPEVGDEVELKRRTATSKLISRKDAMEKKIRDDLHNAGLTETGYSMGSSGKRGLANVILMSIIIIPVVFGVGVMILEMLTGMLGLEEAYGQELVFENYFFPTVFLMIIVTVPITVALSDATQKYAKHTLKGLEASRYMEGLELYIRMAEAERMKMLQSVEGADTSVEGIVKLYEKLLPYAAVFGLEKSWMEEMKEYCELEEIEQPDYLLAGITAAELSRGLSTASTYAVAATTMSSSGGGSSSGFSGGGGGGFSGGGGGGGGFSGR